MGSIFGGGKTKAVKPPVAAIQAPAAVPEVGAEVKDIARRKRPRGFRETFLTGDLIPETGKKKVFG